jgi:hypothetical protein
MNRFFGASLGLVLLVGSPLTAQTPLNACDLNSDRAVDQADFVLAINMTLGQATCTARLLGTTTCNVAVIQRVANAVSGGVCLATGGGSHAVDLSWNASVSPSIAGYNVYRTTTAGSGYVKINSALVSGTSYTDTTIVGGQTYFYVTTAVDSSNNESDFSNVVQATVPLP